MYRVNVFTYNTEDLSSKDSFTDVPEFHLYRADWVK